MKAVIDTNAIRHIEITGPREFPPLRLVRWEERFQPKGDTLTDPSHHPHLRLIPTPASAARPSLGTADVATLLSSPRWSVPVERLVRAWNALGLLGIDLADQLEAIVVAALRAAGLEADLDAVDWGMIASRHALNVCGVDEAELIRRRIAVGGSS